MDLGLAGRTALVTGGRRGIGAAVVRALAAEGMKVAILDRVGGEELEAVLRHVENGGGQALGLEGDAADFGTAEDAVARVVGEWGGLDVLVCSAGVTRDRVSWKMTAEEWDEVLRVNLTGTFACARAAGAAMRGRGEGGRIVAVSSINGLRGKFGQTNYAASKAGVHGLVKALARELGPAGVTVNAVAPGLVKTPMTEDLPQEVISRSLDETVTGRLTDPEDVANAVVFLASRLAGQVTGEILTVDGGQYM
jgi:3-oxoacyl-[acyl-carrier protein] reductase